MSSDSQITSWLWVVQGAPHHGTAGGRVPTPALRLQFSWAVACSPGAPELPEEAQNELLRSWKSPRPAPPLFPHAHKPWRNWFGPCGQSSPPPPRLLPRPHRESRKGTVEREVPSSSGCMLWSGLVLPGFLLPVNQAWCHGAGGVLGPCPVPSLAVPGMLVRKLASSVSPLSDLCWNHHCRAAQLCRCNQDHDGVI